MDAQIMKMVKEVFVDSFELDEAVLTPEAKVFEDLGLDSLDIVDLVVALQKKFGVKIRSDERVREIRTIGDICTFIETLRKEGHCAA